MTSLNTYISIDCRLVIGDDFSLLKTQLHGENAILTILVSMKEVARGLKTNCGANIEGLTETCYVLFNTLIRIYNDLGQLEKLLRMMMKSSNDESSYFDDTLASYLYHDEIFQVRV